MSIRTHILNSAVATFLALFAGPLAAQGMNEERLEELYQRLQAPELPEWEAVEEEIWSEWSKSGSDSMDVLLDRGREAMEEGDWPAAIEHLTALTDHAPDFAEGYNARATAYFNAGLYGPSIEDIQRTLALNPRHFGAMSGLGMILAELGYKEEALEIFQRAHAIHPHRPDLKDSVDRLQAEVGGQSL